MTSFAKKLNKNIHKIQKFHQKYNLCYIKNSDYISKKISKHLLKIEEALGKEIFVNFYITPQSEKYEQLSTFSIFLNSKISSEENILKKLKKVNSQNIYHKFIRDVEIANNHLKIMPTIFNDSYSFTINSHFQKT